MNDTIDKQPLFLERVVALHSAIPEIKRTKGVKAGVKDYKHVELDKMLEIVLPIIRSHSFFLSFHTHRTPAVLISPSVLHAGFQEVRITCAKTGLFLTTEVPLFIRIDSTITDYKTGVLKTTENNIMQGLGSAITYAKRYGVLDILGIAPDVITPDDDGATSSVQDRPSYSKPLAEKVTYLTESASPPKEKELEPTLSVEEQLELMQNVSDLFELKKNEARLDHADRSERLETSIRKNFKDIESKHLIALLIKYREWLSAL